MRNDLKFIPLHKVYISEREEQAAIKSLRSGWLAGDGRFSKKAEELLRNYLKAKFVLLTPSCTAAIELALMVLNIKKGDEVILPSFSFPSLAAAILRQKAKPIFVDIDKDTYNINPEEILKALSKKTKAVIALHYAGGACRMNKIIKIAKKYHLKIIEDAAHALGSEYKRKKLGTIGDIGCFSFHQTKNLTCGEGGAFVTNDLKIAERAEILRNYGTNKKSFLNKKVDKYTWIDQGGSFFLAESLSAVLAEQLKKIDKINKKREIIADYYFKKLQPLKNKIVLPKIIPQAKTNWNIFAIRAPKEKRNEIIIKMKGRGIQTAFHFIPLHSSPMGKKLTRGEGSFPVTDEVSAALIRLPIYPLLTKKEIDYIVSSLADSLK